MFNTNEDLFKQALIEGLNNRIQHEIEACDEEIIVSPKHEKFMKELLKRERQKTIHNRFLEIRHIAEEIFVKTILFLLNVLYYVK